MTEPRFTTRTRKGAGAADVLDTHGRIVGVMSRNAKGDWGCHSIAHFFGPRAVVKGDTDFDGCLATVTRNIRRVETELGRTLGPDTGPWATL
jgi:hypothetical protein